jgi:RNA polymerase sigma-70 factor (ECF subfamily)
MDEPATTSRNAPPSASIEMIWREQRPYLLSVAFRMLGNIGDAEDVVQDALTRLLGFDLDDIDDIRGWLVVVVSRLCLDHLGSARVRRESQQPNDSIATLQAARAPDPADRVTLDDTVRVALLVVLQELSPAERTVFVLHDVFQYPFGTVAEIVGRSPAACRQLALRARRHVEDSPDADSRFRVEPAAERSVAQEFVAACSSGEVARLMELLDPDVVGHADLGPGVGAGRPVKGRDRVGANLLRFFGGPDVVLVTQPVNGRPGALAFRDRELVAILSFTTRAGLINDVHAIGEPRLLAFVASQFARSERTPSPEA